MPVRTIKAQGGQYTGPFSWENRRFSIAELKRLQTIPDAYEIMGNRQVCIEQIGRFSTATTRANSSSKHFRASHGCEVTVFHMLFASS